MFNLGMYADLEIEKTKKNLSEFEHLLYHKGVIPEILDKEPITEQICYLHIDLNSTKPTKETLDRLFPLLEPNGVLLLDDYGHFDYHDTKKMIDEYFKDYPILKLNTGQAIIFKQKTN